MRPASALPLLALLLSACALSRAPAPPSPLDLLPRPDGRSVPQIPVQRLELDNGVRVLLVPDRGAAHVEVGVRYQVGHIHDPPGKAGLAHLVEHLLFQLRAGGPGAPTMFERLDELAIRFNAVTTDEYTEYVARIAPEDLPALIELELQRVLVPCATLDEDTFLREREVVRNELQEGHHAGDARARAALLRGLYPAAHPYLRVAEADLAELADITRDDVCRFVRAHYSGPSAIVTITGRAWATDVHAHVTPMLGQLPARAPAPAPAVPPLPETPARATARVPIDAPIVNVAWPLPAPGRGRDHATFALLRALAAEATEILRERGLAARAHPWTVGHGASRYGLLSVAVADGADHAEVAGVVRAAGEAMVAELQAAEDAEALALGLQLRALLELFARFHDGNTRIELLADYMQFAPDVEPLNGDFLRLVRITNGSMRRILEKQLTMRRARVITLLPGGAEAPGAGLPVTHVPAAESRPLTTGASAGSNQPAAIPEPGARVADVEQLRLASGLRVLLVRSYLVPTVRLELVFGSGMAHDGDQGRTAWAAAHLLGPAAPRTDRGRYDEAGAWFGALGRAGVHVGRDSTHFTLMTIDRLADFGIHGLAQWVRHGRYDADDIASAARWLDSLDDSPARPIQNATGRAVWGDGHPYAGALEPTSETIAALTPDDLERFRDRHYVAANATLLVIGKFDPAVLRAHLEAAFGEFPAGAPPGPVPAAAAAPGPRYLAAHADSRQVMLRWHIRASEVTGRRAARMVLAEILAERTAALRWERALTYGVEATYREARGPGLFEIAGHVDAARAAEALTFVQSSLAELRAGDAAWFDHAFVAARRRVLRQLASARGSRDALLAQLRTTAILRTPRLAHDELLGQVAALTAAQLRAMLADELAGDRDVVLLTGPRDLVSRAYRDAGFSGVIEIPSSASTPAPER